MTVLTATGSVSTRAGGTFGARWAEPGSLTLAVAGEVDAANAHTLGDMLDAHLADVRRLEVDCSAVTFFAVEGVSALQRINVVCARAGTQWVLLPSPSVIRVLRLCQR